MLERSSTRAFERSRAGAFERLARALERSSVRKLELFEVPGAVEGISFNSDWGFTALVCKIKRPLGHSCHIGEA